MSAPLGAATPVLFVPRYEYLSAPAFRPVASALANLGLVPLLANVDYPEASWDGWPGPVVPIWPKHKGRDRAVDLRSDLKKISGMFDAAKPRVMVASSDIGGWRVRLAVREAERRRIPLLLLLTVEIPSEYHAKPGARLRKHLWWVPGRLGSAVFDATVPGDFARDFHVAVPGPALRNRYLASGLGADRIFETGNPAYDSALALSREPPATPRELVFWTEVIHETYGAQYAESAFREVVAAGSELRLPVRVRLHPREPDEMIWRYMAVLGAHGHIDRGDPELAVRAPAVHLAHFSTALERVAILYRPAISINFPADRRGRIFPEACEVLTPAALRDALRAAIADPVAWAARLEGWRRGRMAPLDGAAATRVADVIVRLIERSSSTRR